MCECFKEGKRLVKEHTYGLMDESTWGVGKMVKYGTEHIKKKTETSNTSIFMDMWNKIIILLKNRQ